jgi:hypothetical protein
VEPPFLRPGADGLAGGLGDGGGDPERAAPTRIVKAPMFRKITDAEYEAYLQIRAGFPPRLQAIFDAAEPVIR